jgi:FMN phosphatase YigB (HAD superfamily)
MQGGAVKPIYIFDLDGTLADTEHRLHYIQGEKKDWRGFFAACVDDKPIEPTIRTMQLLRMEAEVWIWTGRSDEVQGPTIRWWIENDCVPHEWRMRKAGDYRPDHVIKAEWLQETKGRDLKRIAAVFEDRDRVVQMWREAGLVCYQVAPGAF